MEDYERNHNASKNGFYVPTWFFLLTTICSILFCVQNIISVFNYFF